MDKKDRPLRISRPMTRVAYDILLDLEQMLFVRDCDVTSRELLDRIKEILQTHTNKYRLCKDPFTGTLCTPEEYEKFSKSYYSQTFEAKWGYPPEWDD